MLEPGSAARQLQLEVIARIAAPQAFKQYDRNRADPLASRQVQAALEKAEAIQAAVALQLALGMAPAGPGRFMSDAAVGLLEDAATYMAVAYRAAEAEARARTARALTALRLAYAVRPKVDAEMAEDDPEQFAAWRAVEQALTEGAGGGLECRDDRQVRAAEWCAAAFGQDHASSVPQRAVRFREEAEEAFQAAMHLAGFPPDKARELAHRQTDHVHDRPPGELGQELGGVGVTALTLAQAAGLSADTEERREVARVLAKPLEHFHARNEAKNAAGFDVTGAAYPTEDSANG